MQKNKIKKNKKYVTNLLQFFRGPNLSPLGLGEGGGKLFGPRISEGRDFATGVQYIVSEFK